VGVRRPARRRDAHPRFGVHGRAELGEGPRAARAAFPGSSQPTCAATATGSGPARGSGSRIAPMISPRWPGPWVSAGSPPWVIPCGMVAQLLYKRHPSLVSGLVLCSTARNVLGSPLEKLAALALPAAAAAIRWNPLLQPVSAPRFSVWRCWARRRPGHSQVGPHPAAPDHTGRRCLGHPGRLRVHLAQLDRPDRCPHRGGGHDPVPHRASEPSAAVGPVGPGRIGAPGGR
jgi:hypothetical protein